MWWFNALQFFFVSLIFKCLITCILFFRCFFCKYYSNFYHFECYQNLQRQVKLLSLSLDNAPIFYIFLIRCKFLGISSSSPSLSVSGSFPQTFLSLCHSYSPPLSLLHFLSYRLSNSISLALSVSLSLSLSLALSISRSHTYAHTLSLPLFLTHTHKHALTHTIPLFLSRCGSWISGCLCQWWTNSLRMGFGNISSGFRSTSRYDK